jgi:blue copper oxidase
MPPTDLPLLVSRRTVLLGGSTALLLAACGKAVTKSLSAAASSSTTASSTTTANATTTHVHSASSATATTSPLATAAMTAPAVTASPTPATAGYNALWIPPALKGPNFELSLAPSSKQMQPGAKNATYGYNGSEFWGPTLLMTKGDQVKINLTNNLAEDTTTHWHGLHIPAEMDGGPHQVVAAGATWSPSFEVKNKASTYWYHPHMHETTQKQMNLGAGGFIIVHDEQEAALALPRTYGVDDIPLMLTSRSFGAGNAINTNTIYGDVLFTNGTLKAEASLPAQMVRFRILNAEIERAYNLGFADGRTFHVIGTDGGLVNAPVPVTRLIMSPGERYEILVDLSKDAIGSAITMQSFNSGFALGFPGGEPVNSGAFGSLLNDRTFDVLRIVVSAPTASGVKTVPATLAANTYWAAQDATNNRAIAITDHGPGSPFTFDNAGYAMAAVNQTVKLDTVEQWKITNGRTFGHSFHIHDVQFAIVARSTGPIPEYEKGWKDTFYIQVNETVSFVAKFDDFVSKGHPFMYHCHMSNHEDEGLMGQFVVTT